MKHNPSTPPNNRGFSYSNSLLEVPYLRWKWKWKWKLWYYFVSVILVWRPLVLFDLVLKIPVTLKCSPVTRTTSFILSYLAYLRTNRLSYASRSAVYIQLYTSMSIFPPSLIYDLLNVQNDLVDLLHANSPISQNGSPLWLLFNDILVL
jgi:hypothetical protein